MSNFLPYHAIGMKGVKFIRNAYVKGPSILFDEVILAREQHPKYHSWRTVRRKE